jgi:hypothetical protein
MRIRAMNRDLEEATGDARNAGAQKTPRREARIG